ncbi:hypothetical protein H632_c4865p0, partial [Helicosporidium sp. ATCC 50920]
MPASVLAVFFSVEDAQRVVESLRGARPDGLRCLKPLELSYTTCGLSGGGGDEERPDADAAALLAETGWAPAAFGDEADGEATGEGKEAAENGETPPIDDEEGELPAADEAAFPRKAFAPEAPALEVPSLKEAPAEGFVLDPQSGYYWDAGSGYYYDPASGLYCHPECNAGSWGSFDAAGAFVEHVATS